MNVISPPTFDHPAWCDSLYCTPGENPMHARRLHRWYASASDVEITVSITSADEWHPSTERVIHHQPLAKVHLEDLQSCREVAGHQVVIRADVDLTATDCRRLAGQLCDTADQLDAVGGVR